MIIIIIIIIKKKGGNSVRLWCPLPLVGFYLTRQLLTNMKSLGS